MHRLKFLHLCIFVFGIILSGLAYAEDGDEDDIRAKKGLVLVEPQIVTSMEVEEEYKLLTYRERRSKWGTTYSLGYSTYEPIYYEPDFSPVDFTDVYSSPELPLIEFVFTLKRNIDLGSVGMELAVGAYQNASDKKELSDSSLTLIPVRVGGGIYLDTLSSEPMFVPYFKGGVYTMIFREELNGGSSHNGNTEAALYMNGGVAFSLDWIDRAGARFAYQESGVESTYIYLEFQKYMASSNVADGDFSNDVSYAGGLKLEF